jgi:hypothetical protein
MEALLNRAVRQKFPDVKAIEIGLNTGASPNGRDENLQNPLHFFPHAANQLTHDGSFNHKRSRP